MILSNQGVANLLCYKLVIQGTVKLMENGFQGKEGQSVPEMTPEKVKEISDRYIELYEKIIAEKFIPVDNSNIAQRIETNVLAALKNLS